ncbi:hypothetical protein KY320_03075 [Candidatus Woesearchaeota archaeon]|nr:hypothetical protein [Candidatus Woesearchaeota archaeon]
MSDLAVNLAKPYLTSISILQLFLLIATVVELIKTFGKGGGDTGPRGPIFPRREKPGEKATTPNAPGASTPQTQPQEDVEIDIRSPAWDGTKVGRQKNHFVAIVRSGHWEGSGVFFWWLDNHVQSLTNGRGRYYRGHKLFESKNVEIPNNIPAGRHFLRIRVVPDKPWKKKYYEGVREIEVVDGGTQPPPSGKIFSIPHLERIKAPSENTLIYMIFSLGKIFDDFNKMWGRLKEIQRLLNSGGYRKPSNEHLCQRLDKEIEYIEKNFDDFTRHSDLNRENLRRMVRYVGIDETKTGNEISAYVRSINDPAILQKVRDIQNLVEAYRTRYNQAVSFYLDIKKTLKQIQKTL